MTSKEGDTRAAALDDAVRCFGEAWARGDMATLEALLSATYTHTDYYGGFHERAAWLDYARRRTRLNTRISFRDVHTRILGDVAIVTGINQLEYVGDPQNTADQEYRTIRVTQVWMWQGGRWLREAFQATSAPSAE